VIGTVTGPALRWASRSPWCAERLPAQPFMHRAVRKVAAGEGIDDALGAAVDLQVLGIGTLYERLDPPAAGPADAPAVVERYLELLGRVAEAELDGEIAVKPTRLGIDLDEDVCLTHLRTLAAAAEAGGSFLWLDMESSGSVDRTLDLYQRLRAVHVNTGITLQAHLRRTAKDVERLLPIAPAVRLVKGSSREPKSLAFRERKEIDANFLALAVTLLRESRTRPGMRVVVGTHDVDLVAQLASHAGAAGIAKDAFEIQMQYGVRTKDQRRLARSGHRVQTLIPYGEAWYPWYMARLAERPANLAGPLRELFRG
jgi:proline dehydrogenase